MNEISAFLAQQIVIIFFVYGLAFFIMGTALLFTGRRTSDLRFARAVVPLAAFGFLHAAHEWIEMFQKFDEALGRAPPGLLIESLRLVILVVSFLMLGIFGVTLLAPDGMPAQRSHLFVGGFLLLWLLVTGISWRIMAPVGVEGLYLAENWSRYLLAIPAALVGSWAFLRQQHTFREHGMPQFGRDLLWCALALFMYGAIGQIFVRAIDFPPFNVLNGANFFLWFGFPIQLFRALMAGILTLFLVRALRAFELEEKRRLNHANIARLAAQSTALETERRASQQMERINAELRLATYKLSLLLDLSNQLDTAEPMAQRLRTALDQIVTTVTFADAGLILLHGQSAGETVVAASTVDDVAEEEMASMIATEIHSSLSRVQELGQKAIATGLVLCLHEDGMVLTFTPEEAMLRRECQQYPSPTIVLALPLIAHQRTIGSLTLWREFGDPQPMTAADLSLVIGIAQQLGLSLDNLLLQAEAQQREKVLAELLRQVVGAQEAERQRIARELHDATGQSLTAVALGLRGLESRLAQEACEAATPALMGQLRELQSFSTNAIGELHRIITDLRPPQLDDLGLAAALRWYASTYSQRRATAVNVRVTGDDAILTPEYRTVLFRMAQEALTNIAKHAAATQIEVHLTIGSETVTLVVSDDGRGFDLPAVLQTAGDQPGWGLVGLRERAQSLGGELQIDTAPGHGTRITVVAPLLAAEVNGQPPRPPFKEPGNKNDE